MSVNPVFPVVFNGGQLTDLPVFTGTLNGAEIMEIVAAPAGQSLESDGVNYQITTALLAALIIAAGTQQVIITQGLFNAPGTPFVVPSTVARVYINKPIAEPTYIQLAQANTYPIEPLVKDIGGTADALGNGITVTFTGGQTADGLATIPIQVPYGGYIFRPITSLNNWTLGSS